jgi:hypothetical protein
MSWVWGRPWLVAIEIAWRWVVGVPLLVAGFVVARHILKLETLEASGLANLDTTSPWIMSQQLMRAWALYRPSVVGTILAITPAAGVAWIIVSSIGRAALFSRIEPKMKFHPFKLLPLQAAQCLLAVVVFLGWACCLGSLAAHTITPDAEPDLVGFAVGAIFYSLGFFTLWALVSWPVILAPVLALYERRSPWSALRASLLPGRALASKLIEINLVMGIVTLALIVLAMVLSAAPLPFSDELGPQAMHGIYVAAFLFFLIASDYFQVVRLKSFLEFRREFRSAEA